jgi:sugar phosphate isomerase/epimerase
MFRNLNPAALSVSGSQTEIIEMALSNGFKGLDLDLVEFAAEVRRSGLPKARRFLDSAGLKFGTFDLAIRWQADEPTFAADVSQGLELCKLAKEMNCLRAITLLDPASDERPFHQNFELHRARFANVAGQLEALGIRLAVGIQTAPALRKNRAFEFMYSFDALGMLVTMAPKNVGVLVDTFDLFAGGGTLAAAKKLPADRIVAVRLSDTANASAAAGQWNPEDRTLPSGTNSLDLVATLQWLADGGYNGPITPWAHSSKLAGRRREEVVKQAGKGLDELWAAAGLTPAGKRLPAATHR